MTDPYVSSWERFAGRPYGSRVTEGGVGEMVRAAQDTLCRAQLCRTRQRVMDSFRGAARPIQHPRSLGEECLATPPGGPFIVFLDGKICAVWAAVRLAPWLVGDFSRLRAILYHDIPAMWRRSGA